MAVYDNAAGSKTWKEQQLYGSSRLGTWNPNVAAIDNNSTTTGKDVWQTVGTTQYELSNHLGNVMATITDKRLQVDNGSGVIASYTADVSSAQEYYAFGSLMPGRATNATGYRYGFNGKENDNDAGKGSGNQQDYGMRIYDPRIGKFLSVDPLQTQYPWYTPYQFAGNTPIQAIDLDGGEPKSVIDAWKVTPPIVGFVKGALDISKSITQNTQWFRGKGSMWWESAKPGAITVNSDVYYSPEWEQNKNVESWVGLVGHETSHREDYSRQGFMGFVKNYLKEYYSNKNQNMTDDQAYRNISTELVAYGAEAKIAKFFSRSDNTNLFESILNNKSLSDEMKSDQMEVLGAVKIYIPALQSEIGLLNTLKKGTQSQAGQELFNKMSVDLEKKLADKEKEVANLKLKIDKGGY